MDETCPSLKHDADDAADDDDLSKGYRPGLIVPCCGTAPGYPLFT